VRAFSTACDYAFITSILSKWRPFSFIFNRGNIEKKGGLGGDSHVVFGKNSPVKKEVWDGVLS
jgi:hypothetical protein